MSLSSATSDSGVWGTVFSQGGEHTLGGLEQSRSTAWTPEDEAAYLGRVREKAERMAADILSQARVDAEQIRESARSEGFSVGMADAQGELDNFRAGMTETVGTVLESIEGQCSHIFQQWRDDIVGIARLAIEKITVMELGSERRAILESLLVESVSVLEKRREVVIRVNSEDEPVLSDIITMTRERFPDVGSWRVRADDSISAGGMVVESESSLAEGRLESRRVAVEEVLKRLVLADSFIPSAPSHADANGEVHES